MGQILDIVPNHMSATPAENAWWNDVLENGPASPHAAYFDIDWRPVKEELRNRILLPILGDQYGQVLESGELKLEYREGAFFLRYFQSLLPIDPRTYRTILTPRAGRAEGQPSRRIPRTCANWRASSPRWSTCPKRTETEPSARRRTAAREGGRSRAGSAR